MAATPIWKGSKDIIEQPNSPQIRDNADGDTAVRLFRGPWDKLRSTKPARGTETIGLEGYYVWESIITKMPGEAGELRVHLSTNAPIEATLSIGGNNDEIEIDWITIEKDIRQHPRYRIGAGGEKEQTQESLEQIEEKIKDPTAHVFQADSAVLELYLKLLRGQTHYEEKAPVIRRRTIVSGTLNEDDFDAGKINEPPISFGSWYWRKTEDRALKSSGVRNWERFEAWTGADYWDEDVYETST